jgi:hypothetical protein
MNFKREYLGEFPEPSEAEKAALSVWVDYYFRTERFDRYICTAKKDGVAMPANGEEQGKICRFSAMLRKSSLERMRAMGIDEKTIACARETASLMSFEQLEEAWNS